MMQNINQTFQEIFDFYGFALDKDPLKFLRTHTTVKHGDDFSTYRNSSIVSSKWMTKMDFSKIQNIQINCHEAMKLWGYREIKDVSEIKGSFNPILQLNDFD